jgi:hypothetical protein
MAAWKSRAFGVSAAAAVGGGDVAACPGALVWASAVPDVAEKTTKRNAATNE